MIWYPYTQMKTMKDPLKVVDAEGVYIYTEEKALIDTISSWWCTAFGYKNPKITQAIVNQAQKFSHIMLAGGLVHEPAQKLADKLASWLPGDLNYTFFTDSGSIGVEVAIKMALQYHMNKGHEGRNVLLSLTNSYHGDSFKTMEAGDDEDYHAILKAYGESPYVLHVPTEIDALEKVFEERGNDLFCFIVEPLLQGAGGMLMYSLDFLKRAKELCDKYDVILIFDEVATGFGRTGYRFVADEVLPDIIVLGKVLTGGHLPMAATVACQKVWDAFYDDDPDKALMHGPTFMGNPLAASAALASIELFDEGGYMDRIKEIEALLRSETEGFAHPLVKDVRVMGTTLCIEVFDSKDLDGFKEYAYDHGVFVKPFLKYMYTMLPYVITDDEIKIVVDTMKGWFNDKTC